MATEESDDNPMKWILQKFGFERNGKIYSGPKTKKNIGLYLLTRTFNPNHENHT